jgi:glycosyltransferase involved in cell wall biosynthesis
MKKVLMISYCFPPMSVVGVYRTIKFVKYLRDFDWEPVILTIKNPKDHAYNPELFKDIPEGVKVFRTNIIEPLSWWERRQLSRRSRGNKQGNTGEAALIGSEQRSNNGVFTHAKKFAAACLATPDKSAFWLLNALPKAVSVIRKEKIDCIYTSTPPHSGHLIGYWARRLTGVPFIADFRAPWTQNEYFDDYKKYGILKSIEERMEYSVHHAASFVISNSNREGEGYRRKYAARLGDKVRPILNGYDPDDFKPENAVTYDKFTIVYIGSLYGRRNPGLFIRAVSNFLKKNEHVRNDFKVSFIGIKAEGLKREIEKLQIADVVELIGFLPQSKAYNYLFGAHVLLMILGFDKRGVGVIPAKLFEYLPTGRPILALIPDGETAQILRDENAGTIITSEDVEKVEEAIAKYYNEYKANAQNPIKPGIRIIEKYTRRYQTSQLAELFDSAVN